MEDTVDIVVDNGREVERDKRRENKKTVEEEVEEDEEGRKTI